jgi:hypothetical protein
MPMEQTRRRFLITLSLAGAAGFGRLERISIAQRAGGKAYGLHRETLAQIPILQMDQNGVW